MLDNNSISHIKAFEGLRLEPYRDSGGTATIGYGNTFYENGTKVSMLDTPITKERAEQLFKNIVTQFSNGVKALVTVALNQHQFGALVSLAYNIGMGAFKTSTVLKRVNVNPNDATIGEAFSRFKMAGGKVSNGLVKRRAKEWVLYKKISLEYTLLIPLFLFFYTVFMISL